MDSKNTSLTLGSKLTFRMVMRYSANAQCLVFSSFVLTFFFDLLFFFYLVSNVRQVDRTQANGEMVLLFITHQLHHVGMRECNSFENLATLSDTGTVFRESWAALAFRLSLFFFLLLQTIYISSKILLMAWHRGCCLNRFSTRRSKWK